MVTEPTVALREELMLKTPFEIMNLTLSAICKLHSLSKEGTVTTPETIALTERIEALKPYCSHRGFRNEATVYKRDGWGYHLKLFACAICKSEWNCNPLGDELMVSRKSALSQEG